jgi:hypothetical protein
MVVQQLYLVSYILLILAVAPKAALRRTVAAQLSTSQQVYILTAFLRSPKAAKVFVDTEYKQPAAM